MSDQEKSEFLPDGRRRPYKSPRNGPMKPEDLIPYGIHRPMTRVAPRSRWFHQDLRIMGAISRQTRIPLIILQHVMVMDMLQKVNQIHREKTGEDALKLEELQQESDYLPLVGQYKNWEARHAAAMAKSGSRPAGA